MKIPNKIPGSLAIRLSTTPLINDTEAAYNYGIGGMSWLSAASAENPIIRQTAPYRKEQFDNQQEAGEQSLNGYWYRSEQSFHGGAGLLYSDPSARNPNSEIRFLRSRGVDVWTQGLAKLLRRSVPVGPTPHSNIVDSVSVRWGDGSDGVFAVASASSPNELYAYRINPVTQAVDFLTGTDIAGTPLSCTTDGEVIYVLTTTHILRSIIGTTGPTGFNIMITFPAAATCGKIAWLKNRLMLGLDLDIYELAPDATSLGTPKYTAPVNEWCWTSLTETTSTIYAVGSNPSTSAIIKFQLDDQGEIPVLTGGAVACQLPSGETALSAFGYLGTFIAIGTNKGPRIGISASDGGIQYGPLLFGWDQDTNVTDWAGRDTFLWCTVDNLIDGSSGLVRIDLSTEIDNLRFAYATDLVPDAGDPARATTLAFFGASDRKYYATETREYAESFNELMDTGYLQTSRIRFSTLEPKLFKLMRIRGPLLQAPLGVQSIDMFGTTAPAHVFPSGTVPGIQDVLINIPPTLQDYISLRFLFNSAVDPDTGLRTLGAELNGWQVKAWPAPSRQRIIQVPVWCFDFEQDKYGNRRGGLGTATARLQQIENIEAKGNEVTFQDFDMGVNYSVVIESMDFRQTAPPPHFQGYGGVITFTLRTLT